MSAARTVRDQARSGKTPTGRRRLGCTLAGAAVATVCLSLAPIQASAAGSVVDPSTYVHSVCTALSSYEQQLNALHESDSSDSSLTDARDRLVAFLNPLRDATDSAVTELQNAGAPKVKNGNKIAAQTVSEVTAARDAVAKAASSAQALDISNREAFQKEIDAVGKEIDSARSKAGRFLDDAKKRFNTNKVLKAAGSQDPSCQSSS